MKCVFCGKSIEDLHGNNPDPLSKEGRCCDECNTTRVVPERLRLTRQQTCEHDWDADEDGWVFCKKCGVDHPDNKKELEDNASLQDGRPDLFQDNGVRRGDY